jgi:hypothetical protein
MVVAMVALFVSLSGVSYGVATGFIDSREIKDNTVSSRDIRQNSIRTEDLRNNEVRGRDIRNSTIRTEDVALNTLTGSDINESRLGEVPSAASAASATNAGTVSTLKTVAPTTVAEGDAPVSLATKGPLTVTGVCEAAGSDTHAIVHLATTEAGSAITTSAGPPNDSNPNFGPGSVDPVDAQDTPGGDPQGVGNTATGSFAAFSPTGAALTATVLPWADASGGTSGICKFSGYVVLNG